MSWRPIVFASGLALLVAACGSSSTAFSPPPGETYPAEQIVEGQDVFLRTCAVCHGSSGTGRAGPNIVMVWERLTVDEHRDVITNGRGAMPAFEITLDPDQIEAVIAYTRTGWL
ncbi:MAG: c-type cytochrome, partial [Actinobacteria bacterium]|nr:c-type cytochrome [Actinomycetota bacterium]